MKKTFRVTFVVTGEWLGDDSRLTQENAKAVIRNTFGAQRDYIVNRSIDTRVSSLRVRRVRTTKSKGGSR